MLMLTHSSPQPPFTERLSTMLVDAIHPDDWLDHYWEDIPHDIRPMLLGTGHFSSVWAIPGNPFEVLKVSHRESDACRHYLRWVADHPHPNAPKIHEISYYNQLMLIRMERYYPHPVRDNEYNARENIPGYKVLVQGYQPDHKLGHEQLCAAIRRNFKDYKFDLHSANVMVDRRGNVIITDPVSYTSTTERDWDN